MSQKLWVFIGVLLIAAPLSASTLIREKCLAAQSRKKALSTRKKTCDCVVSNLTSSLDSEQMKRLEKIYKSRHERILASRNESLKVLIDLDYEINRNCQNNYQWKFPTEDMGNADPL